MTLPDLPRIDRIRAVQPSSDWGGSLFRKLDRNSKMSRYIPAFVCSLLLVTAEASLRAQEGLPRQPASAASKNFKQQSSYGMGLDIGTSLRSNEVEVDLDALLSGIKDSLSGAKSKIPQEELQKVMTELQTQINTRLEARFKALSA